jgi:manganese/zinc/iron transport system permease protein
MPVLIGNGLPLMISHNTLVVACGVAAVGFGAGVIGCFGVLRRRALVGDAAAHATLVGVALAFLATGRRELAVLLVGGFISAMAALGVLVLLRRFTRTRDDAATAIVLSVAFGLGITIVSGITARGIPGGAGLEQFLLGHTAALTAADAWLLGTVSAVAVLLLLLALKEATLIAFDPSFAAATGWPVSAIDYLLVTLVAVMVVVGLPAAGAVLVTALVVIPPVAARQWTDRIPTMLVLSGLFGVASAVFGVAVSAVVPRLATGPLVVLAAAFIFACSFVLAPERGWWARHRRRNQTEVERPNPPGGDQFKPPEVVERFST